VSLTAAEVAEIMRLVEKGGFDELVLDMDGTKLTIRRGLAAAGSIEPINHADDARTSAASVAGLTAAASPPVIESGMHAVTAPLLGTFYRSPKPGAPPFVEVGSTVDEETIVGIIEVMKLMNSVRAGARGTVAGISAADATLVEYGQTLLLIRKAG